MIDCLFDCEKKEDGVHGSDVEQWYGISGRAGGGGEEPTHNAAVDRHALGQDGCYRACWLGLGDSMFSGQENACHRDLFRLCET